MGDLRAGIEAALRARYAVERELGEGAMARVFLARDLKHDRSVAIKVLKPELASAIGSDRFHREIEVVARLAHPHIMPLHDSGTADGFLYYVMPFVEGESVRERLDREGPLPLSEAVRLAREVADALSYAHGRGIVHRDVKPSNVMLSGGHALLSDFGIARLAGGIDRTRLTGTGVSIGTPAYMSPEQAGGEKEIDGRSDLYSLGCVLFEVVTGQAPFAGETSRAVLVHHLVDEPPSLRQLRPDAPVELEGIVRTSLRKEPDDRFPTAEAVAAALDAVAPAIDVPRRAALRRQLARRAGRLLSWRSAVVAVTAVVAAVLGVSLVRGLLRPPEPVYAVADPRGSYVFLPFEGPAQTDAETKLAVAAAAELAFLLEGWEGLRIVQEQDIRGPRADLGLDVPILPRVEVGLDIAKAVRVGTLVDITVRIRGDSAFLNARHHDVAEGETLGPAIQSRALAADVGALIAPIALHILDLRDMEAEPEALKALSKSPLAHQEYVEGLRALYDWRLAEAEGRFREAIEQDTTFALPHYYLAVALYWQTAADRERILDLGPEIEGLARRAVRLARENGGLPGHRARMEAFEAFWSGDYDAARGGYDAILDADSTDSEAWLFRGAVEVHDPWTLQTAAGDLVPRGDLGLARRAFLTTVEHFRDHQLSYGLLFDIDRDVLEASLGRGCPAFEPPGGPLFPAWEIREASTEQRPGFCPAALDSLVWVPYAEFQPPPPQARAGAERLYQETLRTISRWARYAHGKPRPHEEWSGWLLWRRQALGCDADPEEIAELTRQALAHADTALLFSADTTPQARVRLANLFLANDEVGAAVMQVGLALSTLWATPTATPSPDQAANPYLATGWPSLALRAASPVWAKDSWGVEDPADPNRLVPTGRVGTEMGTLRLLGATGVSGPALREAFEALLRHWTPPANTARDRAILLSGFTDWLGPALLLDDDRQRAWFREVEEHRLEVPPVWRGLLLTMEDTQAEEAAGARAWLEDAVEALDAEPDPDPEDLYLAGVLAQRLGGHDVAVRLFERLEACPPDLDGADVTWALRNLSALRRAPSLEALGKREAAARAYAALAGRWVSAEAGLQDLVAEVREGVARLRAGGGPAGRPE